MRSLRFLLESHAAKDTKLTMQMFSPDRSEPGDQSPPPVQDYVLIEGDKDSIRFLGEVLLACAEDDLGCSFDLHPEGAGSAHFSSISTLGIFIHKKPCPEE